MQMTASQHEERYAFVNLIVLEISGMLTAQVSTKVTSISIHILFSSLRRDPPNPQHYCNHSLAAISQNSKTAQAKPI